MTFPQQSVRVRRLARLTSAAAGIIGATLLLGGCDGDGAGVADAGNRAKVDTAVSSPLEHSVPQPTPENSADDNTSPGQLHADDQPAEAIDFGAYQLPLGNGSLLCDFSGDPAAEGFAWACEAPVHLGWTATAGGEANAVSYRPGADPELFALLGNSGLTAQGALAAGTHYSVGGRYAVDTTSAEAITITDMTTGVAVRLAEGGFTRL